MNIVLRLFAAAREAAGCSNDVVDVASDASLGDVFEIATDRYGAAFADVLATSRVWINGDEPGARLDTPVESPRAAGVLPGVERVRVPAIMFM